MCIILTINPTDFVRVVGLIYSFGWFWYNDWLNSSYFNGKWRPGMLNDERCKRIASANIPFDALRTYLFVFNTMFFEVPYPKGKNGTLLYLVCPSVCHQAGRTNCNSFLQMLYFCCNNKWKSRLSNGWYGHKFHDHFFFWKFFVFLYTTCAESSNSKCD